MFPLDPAAILKNVGYRISEMRRERMMTQDVLATRADVTLKYIQRVESGSENLTLLSLVRFANILEKDLSEFLLPAVIVVRKPGRPKGKKISFP